MAAALVGGILILPLSASQIQASEKSAAPAESESKLKGLFRRSIELLKDDGAETESQPEAKPEADSNSETKPEIGFKLFAPRNSAKTEAKPEPTSKTESEPEPAQKTEPKSGLRSLFASLGAKTEPEPEPESAKPASKPAAAPAPKLSLRSLGSSSAKSAPERTLVAESAKPSRAEGGFRMPLLSRSNVRTTAYTHTEDDHKEWGKSTASGGILKRTAAYTSAAADWSRFPLGTVFRIKGDPRTYVVDDYGSALVGTDTIDIYHLCKPTMNNWGVRHVDIEILKFGCFKKSKKILASRRHVDHCDQMYREIPLQS